MGGFFVQSSHGAKGNFELVVPRTGGGLAHWFRKNDDPRLPWVGPTLMFGGTDDVDAAALIQSNFGRVGNLEVVANAGGSLYHYWRDDGGTWAWHGDKAKPARPFATGVVGAPGLVQSSHGTKGNFEVVAPLAAGGLAHWWRNNDTPSAIWHGPTRFGAGRVRAVSLIQSNFGPLGNLEVVALVGGQLVHWSRDDGGTGRWARRATFGTGVAGTPALIQSSHGQGRNFEVVAPLSTGGLGPTVSGTGRPDSAAAARGRPRCSRATSVPWATWRSWPWSAASSSTGHATTAAPWDGASRLAWRSSRSAIRPSGAAPCPPSAPRSSASTARSCAPARSCCSASPTPTRMWPSPACWNRAAVRCRHRRPAITCSAAGTRCLVTVACWSPEGTRTR